MVMNGRQSVLIKFITMSMQIIYMKGPFSSASNCTQIQNIYYNGKCVKMMMNNLF